MTAQSPTLRELLFSRHHLYMADFPVQLTAQDEPTWLRISNCFGNGSMAAG
jgi:hypothetical protein